MISGLPASLLSLHVSKWAVGNEKRESQERTLTHRQTRVHPHPHPHPHTHTHSPNLGKCQHGIVSFCCNMCTCFALRNHFLSIACGGIIGSDPVSSSARTLSTLLLNKLLLVTKESCFLIHVKRRVIREIGRRNCV